MDEGGLEDHSVGSLHLEEGGSSGEELLDLHVQPENFEPGNWRVVERSDVALREEQ